MHNKFLSNRFGESAQQHFLSKKKPWRNKLWFTKSSDRKQLNTASNACSIMVSSHKRYVDKLIPDLLKQVKCSRATQISRFSNEWSKFTSDTDILDMVNGYAIELN